LLSFSSIPLGSRIVGLLTNIDFDVDADSAVERDEADREAGNREAVCVLGIKTRTDVEGPSVRFTFDDATFESTFAQGPGRMRTGVFHGVHRIGNAIEADIEITDPNT